MHRRSEQFISRRRALLGLTGSAVLPWLLHGCGGDEVPASAPPDQKTDAPLKDGTIDDPLTDAAPDPPLPLREPLVRVLVQRKTGPAAVVRIGCAEGWIRAAVPAGAPAAGVVIESSSRDERLPQTPWETRWQPVVSGGRRVLLRAPVRIERARDAWWLQDAWAGQAVIGGVNELELISTAPDAGTLLIGEREFPNRLHVHHRTRRDALRLDVVNHVALETYLPGVLDAELYGHWHPQTFAAQAVAARSFACAEVHNGRRSYYDVTNTQRSQAYHGLTGNTRALTAAQETAGQVLAYRGALVPGYYSSCCGGTAARALDAISNHHSHDVPPLYGREGDDVCTASPRYRWEAVRTVEVLTRRLTQYGESINHDALAGLSRIESIQCIARNTHGRPVRFRITDSRQRSVELDAERFRIAANYSGRGLGSPTQSLYSSHVDAQVQAGRVTFAGRGFGHGVGLCQYGAQALAVQGRTADEILQWYYPQVQITRAY
jgi:stage II sporulation protein D